MLFSVKKVFWVLVAVVMLLMAIYTFNTLSVNFLAEPLPEDYVEKFHIDQEGNLPTWFSAALLLGVAGSALLILKCQHQRTEQPSAQKIFWSIFAGVFIFLSLDEGAQVHELIDQFTQVKWVFLYAPTAAIFFTYCCYSLGAKKLVGDNIARWMIGGLVLYAVGGLLMEWIGYRYVLPYAIRQVRYVAEEGSEMLGVVFILRGCLMEVNRIYQQVMSSVNSKLLR